MINRLPALRDPVRYAGLYIFDFGEGRVAVGYTAQEIEYLLADPRYECGQVYKIYRANTDGTLEIRGVNPLLWRFPAGMVFWFSDRPEAVEAYDELKALSESACPPGEFDLYLVETAGETYPYAMVMRYAQELDDAIAAWLLKINYEAGEFTEGGNKLITQLLTKSTELLAERLGAEGFRKSRSRDEVLESVDQAVQR